MKTSIYIPEPIPSNNKGEEAILQGINQGLIDVGVNAEISLFTYDKINDQLNYGDRIKLISGITFRPRPNKTFIRMAEVLYIWSLHFLFLLCWKLFKENSFLLFKERNWKAYIESDLIMTGHDGMISDVNLLFSLFIKLLGKKSIIFGGGFKSFKFKISELFSRYALNFCEYIVLREKHCHDYILSLGVNPEKIYFYPDPAFSMLQNENENITNLIKKYGLFYKNSPLVGMIALIGTGSYNSFYGDNISKQERYAKHIKFCAKMTEAIIETTSGKVVFIPHAMKTMFGTDDTTIAREIKENISLDYKGSVVLIEENLSAAELKALISKLDFLVSQRLHAVISAVGVATPFIMATSKKDKRSIDILCNTIQQSELVYYFTEESDHFDFKNKFFTEWENRKTTEDNLRKNYNAICQLSLKSFQLFKKALLK